MVTDIRLEDTKIVAEGQLHVPDDAFVPIKIYVPPPAGPVKPGDELKARTGSYRTEMTAVGKELSNLHNDLAAIKTQIVALRVQATIVADAPHYTQDGWLWCASCSGLHFSPNYTSGVCAKDNVTHMTVNSGRYVLFPNKSRYDGQPGWTWCRKCQGLFNAGDGSKGVCAAGGAHDDQGSPNYVIPYDKKLPDIQSQDGWRYCAKCHLLFHGATVGACPGTGGHSAIGANYVLAHR